MHFNSFSFVAFFAVVLLLHHFLSHRARNRLLLAASYLFYAAWDWRFLALLAYSTLLDYFLAIGIEASSSERRRRRLLLVSLIGNVSLLGFFKYYNFFIDSLDTLIGPLGLTASGLHLDLVLPLGISFYTFQTMSYAIDVYRRRLPAVRNLPDFALYVCFFPQLVAGPIERASHLLPQIQRPRRIAYPDVCEGVFLTVWGFFKKVVIADNLARIVDPVYAAGAQPSSVEVVVATVGFTLQLYADFSAYTDIARGTARLLGFRLKRNFHAPFLVRDMGVFWRRWHITLTTWLRDYVFLSLGGSRHGEARLALNLFLTMLLAGLWHGSDGTMFLFGASHGVFVVLTHWYRKLRPARRNAPVWPGALLVFVLFNAAIVFFRGQTTDQCLSLFAVMLTGGSWTLSPDVLFSVGAVTLSGALLFGFDGLHLRGDDEFFAWRWPFAARVLVYTAALNGILFLGRAESIQFVYFQF